MGHKRTIRPNAKKLSALFMARSKMDWDTFSRKVKTYQRGFMGDPDEMRPGRGEFHEFPYSCVCKKRFKFPYDESNDDEQGTLVSRAYTGSESEWENRSPNGLQSLKESREDDQ